MKQPMYSKEQHVRVKNGAHAGHVGVIVEVIRALASETWMYRVAFSSDEQEFLFQTLPYYEDELVLVQSEQEIGNRKEQG